MQLPEDECVPDSTIVERLRKMISVPTPRTVKSKYKPRNDPQIFLSLAMMIAFGANTWWTSLFLYVNGFGTDFPGGIQGIGEPRKVRFGGTVRDGVIVLKIDGKNIEVPHTWTNLSNHQLKVGDPIAVRCIPSIPQYTLLDITSGEGSGWVLAWRLVWLAFTFGLWVLATMASLHSKTQRLLLINGRGTIGQITSLTTSEKGKVACIWYEFTAPGPPGQTFRGTQSIAENEDQAHLLEGFPLIVFYDESDPEWNTAYDYMPWMIVE